MGTFDDHAKNPLLLTTLTVCMILLLVEAQNSNFSYTQFTTPESFLMVDDAQHYPDNYSFLMNARAAAPLEDSNWGRLLYKDPVRMKDSTSGAVASFHTAFMFQISGTDMYYSPGSGFVHADGMAFTFAQNTSLPGQNSGGSLCLLQEQNNGEASNRVFTVEFDAFENYWYDYPSDSHIGVDVNSMNSTLVHNLCGVEVHNCSYLRNGGYLSITTVAPRALKCSSPADRCTTTSPSRGDRC